MCCAIFCKLLFFDRNSHFLILFIWCHFNYMSLPKQWVTEWLCLQEHLAYDGREQREIFNLLWLTQVLNMTFLDKDHVLVNLSLALIPDPSQDFLTNYLGKKIALYSRDQQFNLGEGGNMGRNSCCPLKKKRPESYILWYSSGMMLGYLIAVNEGIRWT